MSSNDFERARRQELAVENAVGGLDREEWLELRRQAAAAASAAEEEEMERAAAAIELARQPRLEPMPRHLLAAIAADADRHFAPRRAPAAAAAAAAAGTTATRAADRGRGSPPAWFAYGGWVAAAACLVAAVVLVRPDAPATKQVAAVPAAPPARVAPATPVRPTAGAPVRSAGQSAPPPAITPPAAPDPTAEREALVAQRFVLRRNWAPAGDPAGRNVQGDVVWDARTQSGYMRFVGLRRNDPALEQYQLWIFDGRRDERYPVDGGVFDVRSGDDGEVIVPIRARLPVGTPLAFAVTIERPGGVVVSDRGRVVVIARAG